MPMDVDGIAVSYRNLGNYLWNTAVPPAALYPAWLCSSGCVAVSFLVDVVSAAASHRAIPGKAGTAGVVLNVSSGYAQSRSRCGSASLRR
jgi:hypothetical protein